MLAHNYKNYDSSTVVLKHLKKVVKTRTLTAVVRAAVAKGAVATAKTTATTTTITMTIRMTPAAATPPPATVAKKAIGTS